MEHQYCASQSKSHMRMNAIFALIIIIIIYFLYCGRLQKEKFTPKQVHAIQKSSKHVFDKTNGKATFSAYKKVVPYADAVIHTDTLKLWNQGKLTDKNVSEIL